ncbi:hypothetical protein Ciccas_002023, partial [Cichlidogyrus casuarinus]
CMEIYEKIKESMELASARLHRVPLGCEFGSELHVIDLSTNISGTLRVCTDGFKFQFGTQKTFVDLVHIKRCFMRSREIFVMEALGIFSFYAFIHDTRLDPQTKRVTMRSFKTDFNLIIARTMWRIILNRTFAKSAHVDRCYSAYFSPDCRMWMSNKHPLDEFLLHVIEEL